MNFYGGSVEGIVNFDTRYILIVGKLVFSHDQSTWLRGPCNGNSHDEERFRSPPTKWPIRSGQFKRFWNWFGKSKCPGARLDLTVNFHHGYFIDPTNYPWVSEDEDNGERLTNGLL